MEKKLLASSPPENLNRPPEKINLDKTLIVSAYSFYTRQRPSTCKCILKFCCNI